MDIPDFLKPNSRLVPPGRDPMAMPTHRSRGPNKWLLVLAIIGMIAFCGVGVYGLFNRSGNALAQPATATEQGALPNPGVAIDVPASATPQPTRTKITGAGLLTQYAGSQTSTASSTATASPTVCSATHFLTQLVCDDLALTATLQAAQPGEVINVSGVDPRVTTVYIYPTAQPSPWIVTASPTWTPVVITATQGPTQTPIYQVVTATPGPTQTPWFFITQPPVVTVVWTVVVTQQVTVVVTATPSDTPIPTVTPAATETPTP